MEQHTRKRVCVVGAGIAGLVSAKVLLQDGYDVVVYDALGTLVWETELAGVSGTDNVELAYAGPALVSGMYYQFRVTSWREVQGKRLYIARTEDLRGVFFTGEAPPQTECVAEEPEPTGGDTDPTGSDTVTTG